MIFIIYRVLVRSTSLLRAQRKCRKWRASTWLKWRWVTRTHCSSAMTRSTRSSRNSKVSPTSSPKYLCYISITRVRTKTRPTSKLLYAQYRACSFASSFMPYGVDTIVYVLKRDIKLLQFYFEFVYVRQFAKPMKISSYTHILYRLFCFA